MNPAVSIIIPTLNEAENLPALVRRADAALRGAGIDYEIILADDGSTDGTEQVVVELAADFPIRFIDRGRGAEGGLSGAVLAGFAEARGEILAVMDADLQHPPEALPRLVEALGAPASAAAPSGAGSPAGAGTGRAEFVVGSRYVPGGSVGERWGIFRKLNSLAATLLARPFAGRVRDPMSGFFALRRDVYERGRHLSPLGYKILLELLCKCHPERVAEVPIHFGERHAGQSKLTLKEQFRYLEHLSRLYDYTFPRASPIAKFAIVVVLGWFVGLLSYGSGLTRLFASGVVALGLSYAATIILTAAFHWRYVRTQRRFLVRPTPWRDFLLSAGWELAAFVAVAWYLEQLEGSPRPMIEEFTVPFLVAILIRYVLRKELLLDVRGLRPDDRAPPV